MALRLLAALPDGKPKAIAEKLRQSFLPERGKIGSTKLRIGTYPVGNMLHGRPALFLPRGEERDWLRGWALVGALRFCHDFGESDRFSRVAAGLRAARRMSVGGYTHDLMAELPRFDGGLDSLISAVRLLTNSLEQRGIEQVTQLRHLELTLRDAQAPIVPRHVDPFRRSIAEVDQILPQRELVTDEFTLTQSADHMMRSDISDEEQAEELRDRIYDFGSTYRALHPAVAKAEAQLELLDLHAAVPGWQAEFAALTAVQARRIFAAALADARRGEIGARLVLASMVSGRTIVELSNMHARPVAGTSWIGAGGAIAFAPDVRFMANPLQGGFALFPPSDLMDWLDTSLSGERAEDLARQWLSRHDQTNGLRLSRIARALRDGLLAQGEDTALVAMLCGRSCKTAIQLYYARFSVAHLQAAWTKLLRERFGAIDEFRLKPLNPRRAEIGSLVIPAQQDVTLWFNELIRAVEIARSRRAQGIDYLVDRLSAEANLAASVLCFQTARRPHRHAFESLSQMTGRRRPRIRLEGKGGRQVDDGRWVPMSEASLWALGFWRATLEAIEQSGLAGANSALGHMIREVHAGRAPLFFEWDSLEAQPEPMSAAALFNRVGAPILRADPARSPMAAPVDNWARHFMRSALAYEGLNGRLIDGYLGHGGAVADPMAPASGFAAADQDQLRQAIDRIWGGLQIELPVALSCP